MLLLLLNQPTTPRLYAVIDLASGWTDPTATQVLNGKNGSGASAVWFGGVAAPTSTTTFDWPSLATGLTAGTNYRLAIVWYDGTNTSNVAISTSFTTSSGGTQYNQSISGSLSLAGALIRQISRLTVGATTLVGSLVKQTNARRTSSITTSSILNRETYKRYAGSITLSGAPNPSTGLAQTTSGSLTLSGVVQRAATYLRFYASSITTVGGLVRSTSKRVGGTLSLAGSAFKGMFVALTASITAFGAATGFKFTPTVGGVFQRGIRFIRRFVGRR